MNNFLFATKNFLILSISLKRKQALLKDIRVKWGKFTELELSGLKNNDDLVSQIVAKYGLDKAKAQSDVDTLRAGRNI